MSYEIMWIGQGGYLLNYNGKVVCIDPYLSNSMARDGKFERLVPVPIEPEDLEVDIIICTHDHIDHLDEATIKRTNMENILYAGPSSCQEHYRRIGVPEENIISLNRGETYDLEDVRINAVFAKHTEDSIGVVVEYKGSSIYITGDSLYDDELLEAKALKPNILISCINGRLGNMNYKEAADLAIKLDVNIAIPSHYGMVEENTEDPQKFFDCIEDTSIEGLELKHAVPYIVKI